MYRPFQSRQRVAHSAHLVSIKKITINIFLILIFSFGSFNGPNNLLWSKAIADNAIIDNIIVDNITVDNSKAASFVGASSVKDLIAAAQEIKKQEITKLLSERKTEGYWFYPPYMGTSYVSQFWLISKWLGLEIKDFDILKFQKLVLSEQLADGSWYYLPDQSVTELGPVGITVLNYWALKAMGISEQHPQLLRARDYILRHGGLEASSNFVKILLAAFGNLDWKFFPIPPGIPMLATKNLIDIINPRLGLWMHAFVPPIAYLANLKVSKSLGDNFNLPELVSSSSAIPNGQVHKFEFDSNYSGEKNLVNYILNTQRVRAPSWGGSTPSTLLSMMALEHARHYMPDKEERISAAIKNAQSYVRYLTLETEASAYRGAIFDGRYWDSVLMGSALLEAGAAVSDLYKTAIYIDQQINRRTGGIGFGYGFEPDMDTDDTAEMIIFFKRSRYFNYSVDKAVEWLRQMQNDKGAGAGGWGAFAKNNNPIFPITKMVEKFKDSTEVFDPSTPDVTGHILEALGIYGYSISNDPFDVVNKAVDYLRRQQKADGTWFGRWGVNSIYGTSFAIIGLREVGISADDTSVQQGVKWILHCQKKQVGGDGGFGESFLSYANKSLDCLQAPSSPTQTAWALLALLKVLPANDPSIVMGINYLIRSYKPSLSGAVSADNNFTSGWTDTIINGTGHPVVVPIFYPSYAKIFPLQAIARWLSAMIPAQSTSKSHRQGI